MLSAKSGKSSKIFDMLNVRDVLSIAEALISYKSLHILEAEQKVVSWYIDLKDSAV